MKNSNVCPTCNSKNLSYKSIVMLGDDECYYPAWCEDCNTSFESWYKMSFEGNFNIEK